MQASAHRTRGVTETSPTSQDRWLHNRSLGAATQHHCKAWPGLTRSSAAHSGGGSAPTGADPQVVSRASHTIGAPYRRASSRQAPARGRFPVAAHGLGSVRPPSVKSLYTLAPASDTQRYWVPPLCPPRPIPAATDSGGAAPKPGPSAWPPSGPHLGHSLRFGKKPCLCSSQWTSALHLDAQSHPGSSRAGNDAPSS